MFDERIDTLFLHLTPTDRVRYIADQLDRPHSVTIDKFVEMLKESRVPLQNRQDFKKELFSYEPIVLDLRTGVWEIVDETEEKEKPTIDIKKRLDSHLAENDEETIQNRLEKLTKNIQKQKQEREDIKKKDKEAYGKPYTFGQRR